MIGTLAVSRRFVVAMLFLSGLACSADQPSRPAGVSAEATWVGGKEGGVWIDCSPLDLPHRHACSVFDDDTGARVATGQFVLRIGTDRVGYWEPENDSIPIDYYAWDGESIELDSPYVLVPDGWLDFPLSQGSGSRQHFEQGRATTEPLPYSTLLANLTAGFDQRFEELTTSFGFNPYGTERHGYGQPIDPSNVGDHVVTEVIEAASRWAVDNCYLPCAFEMGAAVLDVPNRGYFLVHVASTSHAGGPEAMVFVDRGSFTVADAITIHSPCVHYRRKIGWPERPCDVERP